MKFHGEEMVTIVAIIIMTSTCTEFSLVDLSIWWYDVHALCTELGHV